MELPVDARSAVCVDVVSVPEPCGALSTEIDGEEASAVYAPPPVERCWPLHVCEPVVDVAVPLEYVIVTVAPAASVSESTVAVWPETETVPELAVTWPAPAPVCGAVQPEGTVSLTPPLVMPPVAAVYVNATVFPLEPARTELVGVVRVPLPSAELFTVTDGDEASAVSVPPAVDFSCAENVCEPV